MIPSADEPNDPELTAVVTVLPPTLPVTRVPNVPSSNLYHTSGRSAVVAPFEMTDEIVKPGVAVLKLLIKKLLFTTKPVVEIVGEPVPLTRTWFMLAAPELIVKLNPPVTTPLLAAVVNELLTNST